MDTPHNPATLRYSNPQLFLSFIHSPMKWNVLKENHSKNLALFPESNPMSVLWNLGPTQKCQHLQPLGVFHFIPWFCTSRTGWIWNWHSKFQALHIINVRNMLSSDIFICSSVEENLTLHWFSIQIKVFFFRVDRLYNSTDPACQHWAHISWHSLPLKLLGMHWNTTYDIHLLS